MMPGAVIFSIMVAASQVSIMSSISLYLLHSDLMPSRDYRDMASRDYRDMASRDYRDMSSRDYRDMPTNMRLQQLQL
jgi:hypothetical protein